MGIQLSDATLQINNNTVAIDPNSIAYTEGLGEQEVRAASVGGGAVEQVYSNNVENNFSMVKFSLPSTIPNIGLAREWKTNLNQNLVQISGKTPDGKTLTRSFTQAALVNNYEVPIGSDTNMELEFKSMPAI